MHTSRGTMEPMMAQEPEVKRRQLQMLWPSHQLGNGGVLPMALAGLDIAVWDLMARHARLPLWRLLGGHRDRVVRVWDLDTGEAITLEGHRHAVGVVAFSANGKFLASVCQAPWDVSYPMLSVPSPTP